MVRWPQECVLTSLDKLDAGFGQSRDLVKQIAVGLESQDRSSCATLVRRFTSVEADRDAVGI